MRSFIAVLFLISISHKSTAQDSLLIDGQKVPVTPLNPKYPPEYGTAIRFGKSFFDGLEKNKIFHYREGSDKATIRIELKKSKAELFVTSNDSLLFKVMLNINEVTDNDTTPVYSVDDPTEVVRYIVWKTYSCTVTNIRFKDHSAAIRNRAARRFLLEMLKP